MSMTVEVMEMVVEEKVAWAVNQEPERRLLGTQRRRNLPVSPASQLEFRTKLPLRAKS